MEAKILCKAKNKLELNQIRDFVIGCTKGLFDLEIVFNGFYYVPGAGIYLVGPREELEKVKNKNPIEDFDFEAYIRAHPQETFWLMDWWSNIDDPRLVEYKK